MNIFFETGGNILNQPEEKKHSSSLPPELNNEPDILTPKGHYFVIVIKDQLSDTWSDWFEGMTIEYLDNGAMRLSGYVVDQAALMGIMNQLVRLNLTLVSLNEIKEPKEKK
jgi:hypothetical protein